MNLQEKNIHPDPEWFKQEESKALKKFSEHAQYLFMLTHYDWMYRTTGNKKYLDEQKKYYELSRRR